MTSREAGLTDGTQRLLLIYDGACGFCRRWVTWVHHRDGAGRVRTISSMAPGILDELGLSQAEVGAAAWTVSQSGERRCGAAAVNAVLAELRPPWRVLALLYRIATVACVEERLYAWVANRRRCLRV